MVSRHAGEALHEESFYHNHRVYALGEPAISGTEYNGSVHPPRNHGGIQSASTARGHTFHLKHRSAACPARSGLAG